MAAPVLMDATATVTVAVTPAQACSPAVPVGVVAPPAAVSALAERQAAHTHGADDDPPQMRGPPAPLHTPSSPVATSGGGNAAPGSATGDRDSALDADQIAFELTDVAAPVTVASCDYVAPASANAAARAPPVA